MELNVHERMVLIPLLPTEESYAGMGEITTLKMMLVLSGEEADELLIDKDPQKGLDNIKAAAHIKEIPISEWMTKTIRKILSEKDKKKTIKENERSLFEKFVLDYEAR